MMTNPHLEHAETLVRFCHGDDEDATACAHIQWSMRAGVRTGKHCHQFASFAISAAGNPGVVYRRCPLHLIDAVRDAGDDWLRAR